MEIDISISQLKSTYNSYFNSVEQEYNAKKDEKNSKNEKNGQNSKDKRKNVSDSDEEEDIAAPAAAASSDLFEMSDSMNAEFENNNIDNDNDNSNNNNELSGSNEEEEEKKVFGMNEVATDAPPGWTFDTLEEEIEYLRNVNLRLRYELEISNANTNQNDGGIGGIGGSSSYNNGGSSIYYKNKKDLTYKKLNKDKKVSFEMNKAFLNNAKVSPYEFSQRVQSKLPQFLRNEEAKLQLNKENNKNNENDNGNVRLLNGDKMDDTTKKDTIYIPSMVENEIGIIDIKQVDWWDIVDYDSIDCDNDYLKSNLNNTVDGQSVTDQMVFNNGVALDGPFVLVRESDVVDAVACFVAQCVIKMPECRNLSHDQMLKLLDGTFAELREKGPIGKMIQWGQMGYSVYGYGKYAWTLYTNPLVAETILAALAQAIIFFGVL